jgi:hypothetical protein
MPGLEQVLVFPFELDPQQQKFADGLVYVFGQDILENEFSAAGVK